MPSFCSDRGSIPHNVSCRLAPRDRGFVGPRLVNGRIDLPIVIFSVVMRYIKLALMVWWNEVGFV
jgi:hypothetical protein